ncbi:MAG: SulP family inorganic anion transporter, partial [Deltaproteobacteria bacterium]
MFQRVRDTLSARVLLNEAAASLTVFLVALPLSMGIALASGMPLEAGLIAAACGGIVAGAFGGAPLLVSGPAAGLAVVVIDLAQRYGAVGVALTTVVAGVLQLVLGMARVARFATAMAPAVLHGMLAGIGVLIATAQLHVIAGHAPG